MCGLFPCIPILGVLFLIKKVSRDEGWDFYHVPLSWVAAFYGSSNSDILCKLFLSFVIVLDLTGVLAVVVGGKFGVLSVRWTPLLLFPVAVLVWFSWRYRLLSIKLISSGST